MSQPAAGRRSLTCERVTGGRGDVGVRVGVTGDPPTALGRLRQEHPDAFAQAWIAGGSRDDVGELRHDPELLVAIEHPNRREHLNADVAAVSATLEIAAASISWMNAAVFFVNRGRSGTCSQRMAAAARSRASVWGSGNVPSGAYTSIIGISCPSGKSGRAN